MEEYNMSKGIATMLIAVIFLAIFVIGALAYFANKSTQDAALAAYQQRAFEAIVNKINQPSGGGTTIIQPSGSQATTGGIYQYSEIRPYVNFYFEDLTGTARNPTVYIYNKDPKTLSGGEYWGDERAWSDTSGDYYTSGTASSGKLQKQLTPGTRLWFHASISSYADQFSEYTVPTAGDITPSAAIDTNGGITACYNDNGVKQCVYRVATYDTTAWTSSAIDLGVAAAQTNYHYLKDVTRAVSTNNVVSISQIKITNISKYTTGVTANAGWTSGLGIHKFKVICGGQEILIYDYDGGIDKTKYMDGTTNQVYDTGWYPSDKAKLAACKWGQNELASIRFDYYLNSGDLTETANTTTPVCPPTNETAAVWLYDAEGNSLINGITIEC